MIGSRSGAMLGVIIAASLLARGAVAQQEIDCNTCSELCAGAKAVAAGYNISQLEGLGAVLSGMVPSVLSRAYVDDLLTAAATVIAKTGDVSDFCTLAGFCLPAIPAESLPGVTPQELAERVRASGVCRLARIASAIPAPHTIEFFADYIVVVSDVHIDARYQAGTAISGCNIPGGDRCCKVGCASGPAGKFGSPECDQPMAAIDAMLADIPVAIEKHLTGIHQQHGGRRPAAILLVGDYVADWSEASRENITLAWKLLADAIEAAFPLVPVVVVRGNHDGFPINVASLENDWSYGALLDTFSNVMPTLEPADAITARRGFYYKTRISGRSGASSSLFLGRSAINFVVLNTEVANYLNYRNIGLAGSTDTADPSGQLAWLRETLEEYRSAGEHAIVAFHITLASEGQDMRPEYSRALSRIIADYPDVVSLIVNGHKHSYGVGVLLADYDGLTPLIPIDHAPAFAKAGLPSYQIIRFDTLFSAVDDIFVRRFNPLAANATGVAKFHTAPLLRGVRGGMRSFSPCDILLYLNAAATDINKLKLAYDAWQTINVPAESISRSSADWLRCFLSLGSYDDQFRACVSKTNSSEPGHLNWYAAPLL